jgi:hypothetical protein
LLANAVGQNRMCRLPKPVRQQAGSYSFRVVPGLLGLPLAGKAPSVTRKIERVSRRACIGGAGFSRESDRRHTAELSVLRLASSRLKPVPLKALRIPVGPASAGKLLLCF